MFEIKHTHQARTQGGGGVHWVYVKKEMSKRGKKFRPDMSAKKNARSAKIRQN